MNVTQFCFLASYAVAFGLELTRWLKRASISRAVMLLFGVAGLVAHTVYLFNRAGETSLPPLLSSMHDWLLVLGWVSVVVYLFVSSLDRDLPLGVFVLPLVLGLIVVARFAGDAPNVVVDDLARRRWGMLHTGLLVFGILGVLAGFVLSMMYLVQHRRLKNKQILSQGLTLPSLEELARWNRWAVIASVPLLALGMLVGVRLVFLSSDESIVESLSDPLVVVNSVVLAIMVGLLGWLLSTQRPTGKQVAWLTLFAFGFMIVTFLGLALVSGTGHGRAPREVQAATGPLLSDRTSAARLEVGRETGALTPARRQYVVSTEQHSGSPPA